jgi:phospholipase C
MMLNTAQVAALLWLQLSLSSVGAWAQAAEPQAPTSLLKHLVVIFQENHSFDSYFATYPVGANPPGQPAFSPRPGTPSVNGLSETLLRHNPNESNPFRIDRLQAFTCDQDHEYTGPIGDLSYST